MTISYHVVVDRQGKQWRAICPALQAYCAVTGGETREEALTHIENTIMIILRKLETAGAPPPPDELVPDGIQLTIAVG